MGATVKRGRAHSSASSQNKIVKTHLVRIPANEMHQS